MPLHIRLTKKPDGTAVLACTRPDGSATWQRHRHGFFPLHDLTHYAIETVLGLRYGFYGLLAEGWNITDFGDRTLPDHARTDALLTEAMAGLLDQERATGVVPDAAAFNDALRAVLQEMDCALDRPISAEELDAVRARFLALAGQWARTATGASLDLTFPADVARAG